MAVEILVADNKEEVGSTFSLLAHRLNCNFDVVEDARLVPERIQSGSYSMLILEPYIFSHNGRVIDNTKGIWTFFKLYVQKSPENSI